MTQLDFMHARAAEMLRAASPLQHSPWIARLVRDVVDMCAEVATTNASGEHVAICASCGIDERYPTAAHMLDCPIPVNLQSLDLEPTDRAKSD